MRHRARKGRSVLRCPTCGSVRVLLDTGQITGQRYHCLDCDYLGSFILEEDLPPPETG
jgi:predicted RNA-binding Zn-ribbon protein involved in translation (DUF1610 family)